MTDLQEMYSLYASLGYEQGFTDLLAILRNSPRELDFDFNIDDIRSRDVIPAKSFGFNIEQASAYPTRLAGEGAESTTIQTGVRKSRATATIPIISPSEGWVDPVVGMLWDLCKQARWGTATAAVGRMLSSTNDDPIDAGQADIYTDNIADFMTFVLPMDITIVPAEGSGEATEVVRVVEISKADRKLTLEDPTQYPHSPSDTLLVYWPSFTGPEREPSFSLMSLREGMLAPCLVNKLTIQATDVKASVDVIAEFAFIHTFRQAQIDLREARQTLLTQLTRKPIGRLIFGSEIVISSTNNTDGTFGLGEPLNNELFAGYQGTSIFPITVTGVSLVIDNQLQDAHTLHSLLTDKSKRHDDQNRPLALYSDGRNITGTITYKSPMESWAVLERLAGPSSINNGGLVINFGSFKVTLNQLAWRPSKGDGKADAEVERTLEWSMLAETFDDMPALEYATQE